MSRVVGYASDPEPLAAEVVCVGCWLALPEGRDVYDYAVPAELAHLAVCVDCDGELGGDPRDDAPGVAR